jgi:hypothetical protein
MKIKTLAKFANGEEIEGVTKDDYVWTEFVFNINALDSYNESDDGYTTIELRHGMRQTIAIKWEEFERLAGKPDKVLIDSKAAYELKEQQ